MKIEEYRQLERGWKKWEVMKFSSRNKEKTAIATCVQNGWFSAGLEPWDIKSKHKWVTLLCTKCNCHWVVRARGPATGTDAELFLFKNLLRLPPSGWWMRPLQSFIEIRDTIELLVSMVKMAYGLQYKHEDHTTAINLIDEQLEKINSQVPLAREIRTDSRG